MGLIDPHAAQPEQRALLMPHAGVRTPTFDVFGAAVDSRSTSVDDEGQANGALRVDALHKLAARDCLDLARKLKA